MKTYRLPIILMIGLMVLISAGNLKAVNTIQQGIDSTSNEQPEEKKMDGLSLAAYVGAVAGVASFFILPAVSILLLPAAFVTGTIAILSGRRRYVTRRGRGLALAALILGGAFTLFLFASFVAFGLFGF